MLPITLPSRPTTDRYSPERRWELPHHHTRTGQSAVHIINKYRRAEWQRFYITVDINDGFVVSRLQPGMLVFIIEQKLAGTDGVVMALTISSHCLGIRMTHCGANCVKTWWHTLNWKNIMYCSDARKGPSHRHSNIHKKFADVWLCGSWYILTYKQTNTIITIHYFAPLVGQEEICHFIDNLWSKSLSWLTKDITYCSKPQDIVIQNKHTNKSQ